MKHRALSLVVALACAAGCDRLSRVLGLDDSSPAPATRAPSVATSMTPVVPSVAPVVAPSVAPAAPCTATPGSAFHLRPEAQAEAAGPELPAGTSLVVLGPGGVGRRSTALFHVRVAEGGATGYAFLALRELAPTCPFAWDQAVRTPAPPEGESCIVRDGWWPTRAEGLVPSARGLRGTSQFQQDLDGDGTAEALMLYEGSECPGEGQYVLFVHGARGWRPIHLGADELGEHHGREVRAVPLPRGALVLLIDGESFDGDPPMQSRAYQLQRLTPVGELAEVWESTNWGLTQDDWTFAAGSDDMITLTTPSGGRSQTLAWNAAHTLLETRR